MILNIPLTDPMFNEVWTYWTKIYKRHPQQEEQQLKWLQHHHLETEPIYYCTKCKRLEDGTHRSVIAKRNHKETIKVRSGRLCYKTYYDLARTMAAKLPSKDAAWTLACANYKWPIILKCDVNFTGKSYLDVGCQSGYSAFLGLNFGATCVHAFDIRPEILDKAEYFKMLLFNNHFITFYCTNYLNYQTRGDYDIVSCMGLLHYFPLPDYIRMLEKLCNNCNETLILEMRLSKTESKSVGTQYLPSRKDLMQWLKQRNFEVKHLYGIPSNPSIKGVREIWIAERTSDDTPRIH